MGVVYSTNKINMCCLGGAVQLLGWGQTRLPVCKQSLQVSGFKEVYSGIEDEQCERAASCMQVPHFQKLWVIHTQKKSMLTTLRMRIRRTIRRTFAARTIRLSLPPALPSLATWTCELQSCIIVLVHEGALEQGGAVWGGWQHSK